MKKRNLVKSTLAIVLAASLVFGTTARCDFAFAQAEAEDTALPKEEGNYILVCENEQDYQQVLEEYEEQVANDYTQYEDALVVALDLSDEEAASLDSQEGIAVEENIIVQGSEEELDITGLGELFEETDMTIDDVDLGDEQWYLKAIGADSLNPVDPSQIKVEILDSGVSFTEDIDITQRVNLIPGQEEVSPLYDDGNGHGTGIAGVIGAKDNEQGIVGINPNVDLYSVKILDAENAAPLSRAIEGIYWGIENGMDIINMSFGTDVDSAALRQAVADAHKAGILLIAAAGNTNSATVQYPASYKEVLAVGATDADGQRMEEYAAGDELEILAPGNLITTTGLFDGTITTCGTSFSAAEVTAAASYLWAMDPDKSADFIRSLLVDSSRLVENAEQYGAGQLDLSYAIEAYPSFEEQYDGGEETDGTEVSNPVPAEDFGDIMLVNGLWTRDKHQAIVEDYLFNESNIGSEAFAKLSKTRVQIMAKIVQVADEEYGGMNKDELGEKKNSALHGTGHYKKGLEYLFNCAQNVRSGQTVKEASNEAFAKVDAASENMVVYLKEHTEDMLERTFPGIATTGNDAVDRYFKTLGFALHCLEDTFAHRAMVTVDDLINNEFREEHFKDWADFEKNVRLGVVEYRNVDKYTVKDVLKTVYEDNPAVADRRWKDAKKQSAYMLKASLLKTGYTNDWFDHPKYETSLRKVTDKVVRD